VAVPSPTLPTATPSPGPTPSPTPLPLLGLELKVIARGLQHPLDVRARPGDGALFVIEQRGVMVRVADGGKLEPVLDLRAEVNSISIEQGLLGFAFHPDYPADPRVFLYHSKKDNDNVLVSYETTGDPNVLDPGTRKVLLTIDKERTQQRHNGGTVLFGPDGLLYLSVGDAARSSVNGQNPATLPGKILRIDVDGGDPYAIPAGNPFAPGGSAPAGLKGAPEAWWFGLRNPWRFTIDVPSGLAYIADVGQERVEEVNAVPLADAGLNFGWPAFEGLRPYSNVTPVSDVTNPVLTAGHNDKDGGCSITGGEVYRGRAIPELTGHYFYADWCRGWIRSFRLADGKPLDRKDWSADLKAGMVSSFGHDADGELLVLDWEADTLSRIVPRRQTP
jgi:glucose/arabinose dehydrogenase